MCVQLALLDTRSNSCLRWRLGIVMENLRLVDVMRFVCGGVCSVRFNAMLARERAAAPLVAAIEFIDAVL